MRRQLYYDVRSAYAHLGQSNTSGIIMVDELYDLHARIRSRLTARLFDLPIMQNQIRPLYIEAMIEEALGPDWRYVGGNWAAGTLSPIDIGIWRFDMRGGRDSALTSAELAWLHL